MKHLRPSTLPKLLYVLHSGQLFGTERMAIATLLGLDRDFDSLLLAPPGLAVPDAEQHGLTAAGFGGIASLARQMLLPLARNRSVTLVATGVSQSLLAIVLAALTFTRLRHFHIVHGGTDERLSYGRKRRLLPFAVHYVAVSGFVRERLVAHGVPARRITVIENFLSPDAAAPVRRGTFDAANPVRRVALVSRLDPIKRVDLLLSALEQTPALHDLQCDIFGTGWDEKTLRERAVNSGLAVHFAGFCSAVPQALVHADLLLHTCPEEPFGLVILEAMRAGVPVLVPDTGGPAGFIVNGENGFIYRAGDALDLARKLLAIRALTPDRLARIVAAATATLRERFDALDRIDDYRRLLAGTGTSAAKAAARAQVAT
jgi:glycosyltransferase involved in cell wall biosynthesis